MTARSRKQRDRNARIKRARNKPKELLRLKKTLGMLDADGNELMENVKDVVDEKTMEEIKKVCWNSGNQNNNQQIYSNVY